MDKYELSTKVKQIEKVAGRGNYETAMKVADTIDWHRVRNVNILSMVAAIYEKNEKYQEAKDILLLAFERALIGKRLLFKLAELVIKEGSFQEVEDYYREFCDLAPGDPRQYVLRYLILGTERTSAGQLIHTPEQHCNIKLDEKWSYELAELYAEVGMGKLCIMACDKIMLIFSPGKYVEETMELRAQSAPLTKCQMGLAESKDKYEVRLKAAEQEYRAGKWLVDYEPTPERKTEVSPQSYMACQEAAFAVEPEAEYPEGGYVQAGHRGSGYAKDDYAQTGYQEVGYAEEEYPGGDYLEGDYQRNRHQTEVYQEDTYTDEDDSEEAYGRRGYYGNEYPDQNSQDDIEDGAKAEYSEEHYGNATGTEKSYEDEDAHVRVTIKPEDSEEEEEPTEKTQPQWVSNKPRILSDEAVWARMHEAEAQADPTEEMSRISDGCHRPGTTSAQTRILADIKDLGREPSAQESHHLMTEAEYSSSGLDQAIELLKKIYKETGTKNQAAKITGEKLNSKGVFTTVDKLTSKDLITEQAGVMGEPTLQELSQLMVGGETGMNVVLIDVASNLVCIHRVCPGLAKRLEYVGKIGPEEVAYVAPEEDDRPARPVQLRKVEEPAMPRRVQGRKEGPAVSKAQPVPEPVTPRSLSKPESEQRPDTGHKAETRQKSNPMRRRMEESRPKPVTHREEHKKVPPKVAKSLSVLPQPDESDYDDQQEMNIDEFAQYTRRYASDIDCSISEKSMLTLYEWIEITEEDGVSPTKVSAEDLIEEIADKAEDPSFFKRTTGISSSKYDRDGLLILKEEHFV